jgi:mono/diheme cytochrome c family protein
MNFRRNLTPTLIALMGLSLAGCGKAPAPTGGPDLANGAAVFNRICVVCHQANGAGVPNVFPPLAGSSIATAPDPKLIIRIVLNGLQGPIEVSGKPFANVMPPQGPVLSDKDIADVLSYVRQSFGNAAPAVTPDAVAAIRAKVSSHGPWTWAELSSQ